MKIIYSLLKYILTCTSSFTQYRESEFKVCEIFHKPQKVNSTEKYKKCMKKKNLNQIQLRYENNLSHHKKPTDKKKSKTQIPQPPLSIRYRRKFAANPKSNRKPEFNFYLYKSYIYEAARMQVKTTSSGGDRLTPFPSSPTRTHAQNRWQRIPGQASVCARPVSRSAREASRARQGQAHVPPTKVQAKCVRENQSCTEWGGALKN